MTTAAMRAQLAADPRVAAWRASVAAARPPLTPEQLAVLRPACQRMAQHMEAAPARKTEAATAMPAPQEPLTRRSQ